MNNELWKSRKNPVFGSKIKGPPALTSQGAGFNTPGPRNQLASAVGARRDESRDSGAGGGRNALANVFLLYRAGLPTAGRCRAINATSIIKMRNPAEATLQHTGSPCMWATSRMGRAKGRPHPPKTSRPTPHL